MGSLRRRIARQTLTSTVILISNLAFAAVSSLPIVTVQKVHRQELFEPLSYPAVVKAKIQAPVLAEVEGVVRLIKVPLGQRVHTGQSLLIIEQTDPIYQYAPVQVRAPVSGALSELLITEGARVNKGQLLATVTEPRSLKISLEVPAQDLPALHIGMHGQFSVTGMTEPIGVRVSGLSPLVDPATGTASAELEPVKSNRAILYPGRIGKALFKANVRQGMTVLDTAIVMEQDKTFVRLVKDGKALKVPVTIGLRSQGKVEILSGLEEGQKIVARANGYVGDGADVKVEEDNSQNNQQAE